MFLTESGVQLLLMGVRVQREGACAAGVGQLHFPLFHY